MIEERKPRKTLKHKIDVRVDEETMRAIRNAANLAGRSDGAIDRKALQSFFKMENGS